MRTIKGILTRLLLSVVTAGSILPIALFTVPGVRESPLVGASLAAGLVALSFLLLVRYGPRLPK